MRDQRHLLNGAMMRSASRHPTGFTLIEMAVALFIVVLVLGSLLIPLGTQVEQRKISDTRKALEEIREALLGFALLYGRLPCPDTDTDPIAANYGLEEATCNAPTAEGYLPWKTLGVAEMDAWGIRRTAVTSPRFGDWRYRVDRNFATAFTLTTSFHASDVLLVQSTAGTPLTTTAERPVAIVFSAGPNQTPDGENNTYNSAYQSDVQTSTFDDIVIWISRPVLFNRLIAAGRLP